MRFEQFSPLCETTTESFRPLTAADRQQIQAQVLRIATVRAGETLAAAGARMGNVWNPERTAVANGMATAATIPADRLLKIAVAVPYRSNARER